MTADAIIKTLGLVPHPEGGHFRETYRAAGTIPEDALPDGFPGVRVFATSIFYLLKADQVSTLHRLRSDELWHYHLGDGVEIVDIAPGGRLTTTVLGAAFDHGESLLVVAPAGHWFGARLADPQPGAFALTGCTVAPGFDFADFEIADRETLRAEFPQHAEIIEAMTRV